jgi:putative FmdB family regulatory protein
MALYEYVCKPCGKSVELIRPMSDILKPAFCEDCGKRLTPLISVPATFVRGAGGWSSPERSA